MNEALPVVLVDSSRRVDALDALDALDASGVRRLLAVAAIGASF